MKRDDIVVLYLRAEPPGLDHLGREPVYRLKVALKCLLRRFGLRCVRVGHPTDASSPPGTKTGGRGD